MAGIRRRRLSAEPGTSGQGEGGRPMERPSCERPSSRGAMVWRERRGPSGFEPAGRVFDSPRARYAGRALRASGIFPEMPTVPGLCPECAQPRRVKTEEASDLSVKLSHPRSVVCALGNQGQEVPVAIAALIVERSVGIPLSHRRKRTFRDVRKASIVGSVRPSKRASVSITRNDTPRWWRP